VARIEAASNPEVMIKQVLEISATPVFPAELCSNWNTTAMTAANRMGTMTASMAIFRKFVIPLRGRRTQAIIPARIAIGRIMLMVSTSYRKYQDSIIAFYRRKENK
jgi:hypothetical protein